MTARMFSLDGGERTGSGGVGKRVPKQLSPGNVVDHRFEIVESLGQGGMGSVYKARHLILDKVIALKILYSTGDYDDVSEQRFLDEARILGRFPHNNIVEVTDAGVTVDGYLYMAMELLKGETLGQWMERVALNDKGEEYIDSLAGYLAEISSALHELHQKKVIHRDLKPDNIVLHRQRADGVEFVTPKIIDFGIAKRLDDVRKRTVDGSVLGTAEYIAPEVQLGSPPNEQSDVFALGVILYQGLTGQKPEIASQEDLIFARAEKRKNKLIPPSRINPKVTAGLDAICKAALEPNPEMRLETALEFSKRLANLPPLYKTPAHMEALLLEKKPKPKSKSKQPLVLSLLLVLLSVVAILLWIKRPDAQQDETQQNKPASSEMQPPAAVKPEPPAPKEQPVLSATISSVGNSDVAKSDVAKSDVEETASSKIASPKTSSVRNSNTIGKQVAIQSSAENETAKKRAADGRAAFDAKSYDEAEDAFHEVIQQTADRRQIAQAEFYLARIAYQRGLISKAIVEINRALSIIDNPEWRIYLGMFLMTNGDKKGATRQWTRVFCNPDISWTVKEKAEELLADNGISAAEQDCNTMDE